MAKAGVNNIPMITPDKIEKPMIPILYAMEKSGIQLDVSHLKKFSIELQP